MPKTKKLESDSDSDSGPEDCLPSKKARRDDDEDSGRVKAKKTKDGESYWEMGRNKRITVRAFKGTTYIDIREFYEKDGQQLPGKKGISLRTSDWSTLKDLMSSIDDAVSAM